jgi:hypothetical protein
MSATYLASIAPPAGFPACPIPPKHALEVSKLAGIEASLNWFMESPEFETWISQESSAFLWLSGKAGTGKTVLSCYLLEHLMATHAYKAERDVIGFFYLQPTDSMVPSRLEDYVMPLLGSMISQLLQNKARAEHAVPRNPPYGFVPNDSQEATPPKRMWKLLRDLIAATRDRETFVVVDGIDAIVPQQARSLFLHDFRELFNELQSKARPVVKFFISSCPDPDFQMAFKDLPCIETDKERIGVFHALSLY